MACDRMGIMCKPCKEVLWFAKTAWDGYYNPCDPDYVVWEMNCFFDKHKYCEDENGKVNGEVDYKLIFESDDESDNTTSYKMEEDEEEAYKEYKAHKNCPYWDVDKGACAHNAPVDDPENEEGRGCC